jgi:hypothetical protein
MNGKLKLKLAIKDDGDTKEVSIEDVDFFHAEQKVVKPHNYPLHWFWTRQGSSFSSVTKSLIWNK